MTLDHFAVVGAGAWGTALANAAARAGRSVTLIARDESVAATLRQSRQNPHLPGARIDERVAIAGTIAEATLVDAVLLAVPAQSSREAAIVLAGAIRPGTPVIACAKGIERGTRRFMTEVVAASASGAVPAILSGPSFATDVARGLPTAVTLAARERRTAEALARALGSATFRPYHTTDVRGVEIGGAAKNVLAIAAGIVAGRGLGASAAAALTTRGFAELMRFGTAYGARAETLTGLSGLGDLILTCSTAQSRNFSFGVAIGRGERPDPGGAALAEGAFTASVLIDMAIEKQVEMPVAAAIAAVLEEKLTVDGAIEALLTRPLRGE